LQITVVVPIYMGKADDLYSNSAPSPVHRLAVVVTAFQDDDFYPLAILSTNEMVMFEAEVKRSGTKNLDSGDKTAVATGVGNPLSYVVF
jgi:hypothetical protein